MTKNELLSRTASYTGMQRKDVEKVVDAFLGAMKTVISNGDTIQIKNFGTMGVRTIAEHKARSPRTGETIVVPRRKRVYFKASKSFIQ